MPMNQLKPPDWMNDPSLKEIDPKKLQFLEKMFHEIKTKDKQSIMSFLLPMMQRAKLEKLTFTPQEMQLAITAIRKYSTESENEKIDQILAKTKHRPG
jgi:predicted transcriptional regulator